MKEWFSGRTATEKQLLAGLGIFLLIVGVYLGLWSPGIAKLDEQLETLSQKRTLLAWMEQQSLWVKSLSSQQTPPIKDRQGQSLLGWIPFSAKQKGLEGAIKRISPMGERAAQVWMEQVSFDDALVWLAELQDYQIHIRNLVVRKEKEGGVSLDVVLEEH